MSRQQYPSDSKEKKREYYQHWKDRMLALDPDFFSHNYQRQVARYGRKHLNELTAKWRKSEKGIIYRKHERTIHKTYYAQKAKEWGIKNKEHHSQYVQEWVANHPGVKDAHYIANHGLGKFDPIPIAEFCEV